MADHELISYHELFDAIENDASESQFRTAAQFLMEAMNDWPTLNLKEPQDLIAELRNEVKDRLTFDNLNSYSKSLSADKEPWKMEALASILTMFNSARKASFDKSVELEDIIVGLTKHYRHQNI